MDVNKLFRLHSPSLRCLALRNQLFGWCLINAQARRKSHSASAPVPFAGSGTALVPRSLLCVISQNICNSSFNHLSRYSASTIMRSHTKAFSFMDYDVIGFDLDGTLLRYNLEEVVPFEYDLLSRYLVESKGYSNQLLRCIKNSTDMDFLQKGLFLDAERGNILKLSNDGSILKANHGTRSMNEKEITDTYGVKRQWPISMQFIEDPLCAWNGPLSEKMRSLLDYFDITVSLVFAHAVDEVDIKRQQNGELQQPYTIWPDILEALISVYSREHFATGHSRYFETIKNEPHRFVLKTSPIVIDWLKKLKASNKIVFLLTGSHIDFANCTASYAIGENWRDLFDLVICFARKPAFFHESRCFHKIEGFKEADSIPIDDELKMNSVYSMGSWDQLQKQFANKIGKDPCLVKSLYVGDNLIQDVYAPAALTNMDCVAVSEEMLAEYSSDNTYNPQNFEFRDVVISRYWNSYFFCNGEATLWADIIAKYSKMCIPTLDHVASKPIDQEYCMDNENGFYPSAPESK